MLTKSVSALNIHKLTKEQYERELEAGNIDEYALYLTPDEEIDLSQYATIEQLNAKADAEHTHDDRYYTESEIDTKLSGVAKLSDIYNSTITTSGDGATYTATIDGITELTVGISFIMLPHVVSTTTMPTLNVNDLGTKYIRRRLSTTTGTTVVGSSESWITANKPIRVIYDGTYWVVDLVRPGASDIYGVLPIASGGTGGTSVETALENLGLTTETWTFTLEDGSTVTKAVYVG